MNINIEKKFKVIDSVFFNGEVDYLLFRFLELNDSVNYFIVLESISDEDETISEFEKNIDKFKNWEDKIIHVKSKLPSEEELSKIISEYPPLSVIGEKNLRIKQIYDLCKSLDNLDLFFDDIIMISEIDELPVVPPIDLLHSYLSFEPVILSQKDFIWSKDFIKLEHHFGTICLSYSNFVLKNGINFLTPKEKTFQVKLNLTPINYGYRFSYFMGLDESLDYISKKHKISDLDKLKTILKNSRENLVSYDLSTLSNPRQLKKYFGELPKHIGMLSSQDIGKREPKKHLIVFSFDSLHSVTETFDTISLVKPSSDLSDKVIKSDITVYPIFTPNKKYYDILIDENTLENFQKMYFINEVKKVLYDKFPIDIDVFVFYYKGRKVHLKWSEIENEFLYDLLEVN